MSAIHALPGDVIEVKEPVQAASADGVICPLPTGYYALMRQNEGALVLVPVREVANGEIAASGSPWIAPAAILPTEAVGVTYLKLPSPADR